MSQGNVFRNLFDLGYRNLVPIVPPDANCSPRSHLNKSRGKAVGVKGNNDLWHGYDWYRAPAPGPDQLELWHAMGAGVGIRTGYDGIVAIDIDALDPAIADQANNLARTMLGPAPKRIGRWPKCLRVYRVAGVAVDGHGAPPYQRVDFNDKDDKPGRVELLSTGRQFVCHGIHPVTLQPYTWPAALSDIASINYVTPEQIDAYFVALASVLPAATQPVKDTLASDRAAVDQATLIGDPEAVAAAVLATPNTYSHFPTYDEYIRMGAAIKGATQNDPRFGEELWHQWASAWPEYEEEKTSGDYFRIKPPFGIGASYLYDQAERLSGGSFSAASVLFEDLTNQQFEVLHPGPAATPEVKGPIGLGPSGKYEIIQAYEAIKGGYASASRPLVKGLLDQGAMTVLYGESNVGKTFVAMDIAFHIAAGLPWGSMKTAGLPVVYVVAEGGRGALKRVDALYQKYGSELERAPFYILRAGVDLLRADGDTKPLAAAIKDLAPTCGLIVIDTLSRALAGGDENSSTDMGALVRNVDLLRSLTSAHTLVVHHSGKNKANGARGHSLLRAATDTEIEIEDGKIQVTKQRDLDKSYFSCFELETHTLGLDDDGELIQSCTVKLVDGKSVKLGNPTPAQQELLDAVRELSQLSGAGASEGVTVSEVLSYMGPKAKVGTVRGGLSKLKTLGHLVLLDGNKWALAQPETRSRIGAVIQRDPEGVFD